MVQSRTNCTPASFPAPDIFLLQSNPVSASEVAVHHDLQEAFGNQIYPNVPFKLNVAKSADHVWCQK